MIPRFRISLGTMAMVILTAAAAAALYAKVHALAGIPGLAGMKTDVPALLLLAIGLTSVALGSWKGHSAVQVMLQGTLACLGCLTLLWTARLGLIRPVRYWFQGAFALTVTLPMLARHYVKSALPRGPRRDWWKKTCEAVFFSGLGLLLVSVGGFLQLIVTMTALDFLGK